MGACNCIAGIKECPRPTSRYSDEQCITLARIEARAYPPNAHDLNGMNLGEFSASSIGVLTAYDGYAGFEIGFAENSTEPP